MGFIGWFKRLTSSYGGNFIVYIIVIEHLIKGMCGGLFEFALPYVFRDYHTPAPQMQMFGALAAFPWAMKPIIGLISDVFPVGGYNKWPYILLTSIIGTASCFLIGLMSKAITPVLLVVVFAFFMSLQTVTADVLTQGKYTQKVKETTSLTGGTDLLTFVWCGIDGAGIVGVLCSGILIKYLGAKAVFTIIGVFFGLSIVPLLMGYLEEKKLSDDEVTEIRQMFSQQKEAVFLAVAMFVGTIVISICILLSDSSALNAIVAGCIVGVLLILFSVLLSPRIAMVNAFSLFQSLFPQASINGAVYYFCTDTAEEFPGGPNFSKFYFNTVLGCCAAAAGLLGIYSCQRLCKRLTYRKWLILANIAFCVANLANMLFYKRINRQIGIPDWIFAIFCTIVSHLTERWKWMPLFVAFSYLSPRGMEATMFALLMGFHNMGASVASNIGAALLTALDVKPAGEPNESAQFRNLWMASAYLSIGSIVVIILFWRLLPEERQNKSLVGSARYDASSGSLWEAFSAWRNRGKSS